MPANLRIGIPTIGLAATTFSLSSGSASTTYPLENLLAGNKTDRFELASGVSGNVQVNHYLGAAASADFVYVGGARRLLASGVSSLNVRSHTASVYASGADATLSHTFSSANLCGPGLDDFVATFTSVSRQFWWVNTNAAGSSNRTCDKLFLGASLDLDRDPDADGGIVTTRTRTVGSQRRAAYAFDITWGGVSYTKTVQFYRQVVLPHRYQPVVLFTTTYHEVLNNHRAVFCRLVSASMPPRALDFCDITARFEEIP